MQLLADSPTARRRMHRNSSTIIEFTARSVSGEKIVTGRLDELARGMTEVEIDQKAGGNSYELARH
jgi:hypothetical protein